MPPGAWKDSLFRLKIILYPNNPLAKKRVSTKKINLSNTIKKSREGEGNVFKLVRNINNNLKKRKEEQDILNERKSHQIKLQKQHKLQLQKL